MLLPIEILKRHLNIDSGFTEDDEYIMALSEVAEAIVQKHIDCSFDDIVEDDGSLPTPIVQAILLMVGNLYANRESISFATASEIPLAYTYLLSLYKKYNKEDNS